MRMNLRWAAVGVVLLVLAGCTGGDSTQDQPAAASTPVPTATQQVPDAQQLAEMLVTSDELDGEWSSNPWGEPPTDRSSLAFGTGPFLCGDAPSDSINAMNALRWQAIRQLDWPTAGRHIRQVLLADEPSATGALFADLRDGLEACVGSTESDERGRSWVWESIATPDVGDDRIGVLISIREPGVDVAYLGHVVLVRDGPVVMYARIGENLYGAGAESGLADDEIRQQIQTMADKIA